MFMRRSREAIVACILKLCKEPITITRIVYQCNLNFKSTRAQVNKLISAGLLTEISGDRETYYQTTPKGLEILDCIKVVDDLFQLREGDL